MQISKPILVLNDSGTLVGVHPSQQTKTKWFAIVRLQNNGVAEASFIQVAANIGFRKSDPRREEYNFPESAFYYVQPPPTLQPFIYTGAVADTEQIGLSPDVFTIDYSIHRKERFYAWGKIRFSDGLGNRMTPDSEFCRYANGNAVIDAVLNAPSGYAKPWQKCSQQ